MSQSQYLTTPGYTFPQVRAAMRSPAQFTHAALTRPPETFHGFDEAKADIAGHATATADKERCFAFEVVHVSIIEGITLKTMIDGEGEGFIIRRIVTGKDRPRGDAAAFAFMVADWDLDLWCAMDLEICGMQAFEWIVTESTAPYECHVYQPTPGIIASGKEKLMRALANIKLATIGTKKEGREVIDITPGRAKELESTPTN